MLRKIVPALTAGLLVLASLPVSAVPAAAVPAETVTAAADDSIDRANQQQIVDVFNGINAYRASHGVAPVTFNVTVSEMAEDWSDQMAATGSFYHNPNYAWDARVADRWSTAGEIIAANSGSTGQSLVDQWIGSAPHAQSMRNPNFKVIGVGITRSLTAQYRLYGTVNLFAFLPDQDPAGAYTSAQDFFDGKPSNNITGVTPIAPTNDPINAQYLIPDQTGVEYYVDGVLKEPGVHHSQWQAVRITAKATAGYFLQGPYTWWFPAQARRITAVAPTFDDAAGTYTVPLQEGVYHHVQEGPLATPRPIGPGTHAGTGYMEVHAYAADTFILDGTWAWGHTFSSLEEPPAPPVTEPPAPAFADASQSGFESAINWMRTRNISKGYPDNTYRPFESVTREAMAAFVYRLAGEPAYVAPVESPFNDVGTGHGFYKEIAWMKATGLSNGWSDGTYRPYDLVSREAMAAFMKRYAGAFCHLPGAADFVAPPPTFVDSPASGFYKEIEWMRVAEVSKGWSDGTYRPFDNVTREAMAAFMQRLDTHVTASGGCAP